MNMNIKLCEDCGNLICKNGKMLCHEMWDKPCEELEECPEGFTMEEVVELEEKTKGQRVDHGITQEKRKDSKPRTVKISDEKKAIFHNILTNLQSIYGEKVEILKENKLISLEINGRKFKIDLIEQRKPKK